MSCCPNARERSTLNERASAPGFSSRALEIAGRFDSASSKPAALELLRQAVEHLGADAGWFTGFIRDDATLASYRCLLACDPAWGTAYARDGWFADDPWLRYAMQASEPIRSSELVPRSPRERSFVEAASAYGFRSALIAPTPSAAGHSRVGVLCLGSATEGFFDDDSYRTVKLLARCLAMEVHGWWQGQIKAELIARSRITEAELDLLRHEDAGHSSKAIAAGLQTEAKTIDCRFQRINAKLGTPNRRAAVRVAKLYGLL
jgi:DNA-binding CsgD family transcriptional regulator